MFTSIQGLARISRPGFSATLAVLAAVLGSALAGMPPARADDSGVAIPNGPFAEKPFDSSAVARVRAASRSYVRVLIYDKAFSRDYTTFASRVIVEASGIIVSPAGHVVTAAHIARNPKLGARLETLSGRKIEARILNRDPGQDIALLKIEPFEGMTAATLAGAPPGTGAPVLAIGTPRGRRGVPATGKVMIAKRITRLDYGRYGFDHGIEIEIGAASRYSGGPVIDANGEVTGMIAAFLNADTSKPGYTMPGVAFAVPAATIRAYLAKWGAQ